MDTPPPVVVWVSVEDPAWEQIPGVVDAVEAAAQAAAAAVAPDLTDAELSVALENDAAVRELNRDWRGQDKPTNVLSFSGDDWTEERDPDAPPLLLGDVALAYETVRREAEDQGKTPLDHLRHLTVHGVLHLLGFDHEDEAEAEAMERLEADILAGLGVDDPYAADRRAATE